jgi:hypothetical protein
MVENASGSNYGITKIVLRIGFRRASEWIVVVNNDDTLWDRNGRIATTKAVY